MLEQLSVLEIAILQDAVSESLEWFDLLFVNQRVSDAHNSLLHFLGKIDTLFEESHVLLSQVQSIVSYPEIVVKTILYLSDSRLRFLVVWIGIFLISSRCWFST